MLRTWWTHEKLPSDFFNRINFSLLPSSPAIDSGNPDDSNDPDGSRADMGWREDRFYHEHGFVTTTILDQPGDYLVSVPVEGDYIVTAFMDINGNHQLDEGEARGAYASNPIQVDGNMEGVNLTLEDPAIPSKVIFLDNNIVQEGHPEGILVGRLSLVENGSGDDNSEQPLNIDPKTIGTKLWEFETDDIIYGSATLGDNDTLYFGSSDHKLYALDSNSGSLKWRYETDGPIVSTPLVTDDGIVYIGSRDSKLYAIQASDGTKLWEYDTGNAIWSSASLTNNGTVVVGSNDSMLHAIDQLDGTKKWTSNQIGWVYASPISNSNGTIYLGSMDGYFYALGESNGVSLWEFQSSMILSSPALDQAGNLYVGSMNGNIYRLDASTGEKYWEFKTGGDVRSSPVIDNTGNIFVGSGDFKVYSIRSGDGTKNWEFPTEDDVRSSPTVGEDGVVYVGSWDNHVYALDSSDGSLVWKYQTGDKISGSTLVAPDGTVYIGSHDSKMYALQGSSGPAVDAPWPMFGQNVRRTGKVEVKDEPVAFTLISGEGDSGNDYFEIIGDQLKTKATFDFEAQSSYSIRIQARVGEQNYEQNFLIYVTDINEEVPSSWLTNGLEEAGLQFHYQIESGGTATLPANLQAGETLSYTVAGNSLQDVVQVQNNQVQALRQGIAILEVRKPDGVPFQFVVQVLAPDNGNTGSGTSLDGDNDGFSDAIEDEVGSDPYVDTSLEHFARLVIDPDDDGFTSAYEQSIGSDERQANSLAEITGNANLAPRIEDLNTLSPYIFLQGWFWVESMGWMHTKTDVYPWVYHYNNDTEEGHWLWFLPAIDGTNWYFNNTTKEWKQISM